MPYIKCPDLVSRILYLVSCVGGLTEVNYSTIAYRTITYLQTEHHSHTSTLHIASCETT